MAQVVFERPQLVDTGGDHDASQTGATADWHKQLDQLLPITSAGAGGRHLRFHNYASKAAGEPALGASASICSPDQRGRRLGRATRRVSKARRG